MPLTVNSNSQFRLYFAEPSKLRSFYKINLEEVHGTISNSEFETSFYPKERKDFINGNNSKIVTEWDLAVINIAYFPFKALQEYVDYQLDLHVAEQNKMYSSANPFIEPRIVIYRKFDKKVAQHFLERFASEMEGAFKTTFALPAFDPRELNNILIEILNLRKKNRIMSN